MQPVNFTQTSSMIGRLRQHFPKHLIGEILTKRWSDSIMPFCVTVLVVAVIGLQIDGYFMLENLNSIARLFSEIGIVTLGMGLVVMVGGIDLSVGSIFALANFASLYLIVILEWPLWLATPIVLLLGGALGAVLAPRLKNPLLALAGAEAAISLVLILQLRQFHDLAGILDWHHAI